LQKLLLLLILSFFSAQSFAGSCPDGSDPVKSLSADGTYFVYNCGNNNNSLHIEKEIPVEGLKGVGVNSMALWGGGSRADPYYGSEMYGSFIDHFKPLSDHGFSHVVLISCVDYLIDMPCKKNFQDKSGLLKAIDLLINNTDLHIVVQPKAYKQKKVQGKHISTFQTVLENDKKVEESFIKFWTEIAEKTKHIPSDRLSFNLLNEPEFQIPSISVYMRDKWLSIASELIESIRSISSDRVVIVEGIAKSLFNDRNKNGFYRYSFDSIIKPLEFDNLIYAFHSYEPEEFLQQSRKRYGSFGRPYKSSYSAIVASDATRLVKWANRHQVPVMITETGCIGYVDGKEGPSTNDECGKYAKDVYDNYVSKGVGVTWWALEKEKTIYNRKCLGDKGCDSWMPINREPNQSIFSGFRLNYK